MFKSTMFCHVNSFGSAQLSIFGRYIAPLLNESNILLFGDDLSGANTNLILNCWPLKTTIDIPIIISYIIVSSCLNVECE